MGANVFNKVGRGFRSEVTPKRRSVFDDVLMNISKQHKPSEMPPAPAKPLPGIRHGRGLVRYPEAPSKDPYSEAWRMECEARYVINEAPDDYLNLVEKKRGLAARRSLENEIWRLKDEESRIQKLELDSERNG